MRALHLAAAETPAAVPSLDPQDLPTLRIVERQYARLAYPEGEPPVDMHPATPLSQLRWIIARLEGKGVASLAAFLLLASVPAYAQTSQTSAAQSGAVANAIVLGGGGGSGTTTYRGGVENVPSVYGALSVAPCTTAAQIGGAFLGGGFTASLGSESEGCARRANAAAFHAMGRDDVAIAILAQDPNVAKALRDVEQARLAAAPQPVQQTRPGPTPVAFAPTPAPEWCKRAAPTTDAGRDYVRQACGRG